ncbi:MFS transporter [Spirillospora sp. NPDC127200]
MLRRAPSSPALVWLAAWPVMAVFTLSNAATPLYPLWRERMGFSAGTMTVVFACYIAGLLGALPVAGVVSDRLGRRKVMVPAVALALVACLLFATASSVAALAAARLLAGVAVGATVSAGMAAVADVAGPDGKARAALASATAMVAGAGTGVLLAGVLAETAPDPVAAVFGLEAVLIASAGAVFLRLPLRRPAAVPGTWVRVPSVPRAHRGALIAGVAVFGPGITATSFVLSLGPSLLADLLGTANRIVAGGAAALMFAAATGAQFAMRRRATRTTLLTGASATVAGLALLALAVHLGSVAGLVAAALLAGAGQGLGFLGGLSLLNAAVPPGRLAEANAALNVGGYLPAGLLPVGTGYLGDAVGLGAGTTAFAAVLIAISLAGAAVAVGRGR